MSKTELFPNAARARSYGAPSPVAGRQQPNTSSAGVAEQKPETTVIQEPPVDANSLPSDDVGYPSNSVCGQANAPAGPAVPGVVAGTDDAVAESGPEPSAKATPPDLPATTTHTVDTSAGNGFGDELIGGSAEVSPASGLEAMAPTVAQQHRPVARSGWRGRVNRLGLRLPAAEAELHHLHDRARVLTTFSTTQSIAVANPKGGAGKTPTTWGLAATFGYHRGGYTLAWDNNETRGTLGLRAEAGESGGRGNVIDLLGRIDHFLSTAASVGRLGGYVRPQSAHFDVLASDEAPGRMDMVDDKAFVKLQTALGRFYRLMVVDTGNNVRAPNWFAAVRSANALVVPTTVQADVAYSGLWMLDHVHRLGGGDLVRNAVAVVTCSDPHVDQELLAQILAEYQKVVREVVVIPFDEAIRPGVRLSYRDLARPTRRAYLSAAGAVIDSLAVWQPALPGEGNR